MNFVPSQYAVNIISTKLNKIFIDWINFVPQLATQIFPSLFTNSIHGWEFFIAFFGQRFICVLSSRAEKWEKKATISVVIAKMSTVKWDDTTFWAFNAMISLMLKDIFGWGLKFNESCIVSSLWMWNLHFGGCLVIAQTWA